MPERAISRSIGKLRAYNINDHFVRLKRPTRLKRSRFSNVRRDPILFTFSINSIYPTFTVASTAINAKTFGMRDPVIDSIGYQH